MEAKGKATKAAINHPLRYFVMNCQSIKNKKTELHQLSTRQNQTSSWGIIVCRTLYIGSFYRPDKIDNDYLEEFNPSLSRIMSNRNAHVLVRGDFNCGAIEWSHVRVPQGYKKAVSTTTFGYYRGALSYSNLRYTNAQ